MLYCRPQVHSAVGLRRRGARGRSERIRGSPRSCRARIGCGTSFFLSFFSGPLPHRDSSDAKRHRRRDCGAGGSGQSVVNWRLRSRGMSARWESLCGRYCADCAGLSLGRGVAPPSLRPPSRWGILPTPHYYPPCPLLTPEDGRGARTSHIVVRAWCYHCVGRY